MEWSPVLFTASNGKAAHSLAVVRSLGTDEVGLARRDARELEGGLHSLCSAI